MNRYLLEGKAECSTGVWTFQVDASEMTVMTGSSEIGVQPFTA